MTTPKYAIEWNRDALVADRQTVARLMLLADALIDSAELHEAENCFRQAVYLAEQLDDEDDTRCDLAVSFGQVLLQLDKCDEAETWLRRAELLIDSRKVEAKHHSGVYQAWADFYRQKNDPATADRYSRLADESFGVVTSDLRLRFEAREQLGSAHTEKGSMTAGSMEEPEQLQVSSLADAAAKNEKWNAVMDAMMTEETMQSQPKNREYEAKKAENP